MVKKRVTHSVDEADIVQNVTGKKDGSLIYNFALTLDRLLVENAVDQEKMASDLGISEGAISNYRRGKAEPKLSTIIKIANYFGVDCHYLMTGIQSKHLELGNIGLSEKAIDVVHSLKLSQEEIGELIAEHPEASSTGWRSEDMHALNAMIEAKSFRKLLWTMRDCQAYSTVPTDTEGLFELLFETYPELKKDDLAREYRKHAIFAAEKDRYDLTIFNAQRAATALAEELSGKPNSDA